MKVLVCGSRTWTDAKPVARRLKQLPRGTTIISGAARGADQMAAVLGRALGFSVEEYPANWRPGGFYNPRAGKERNLLMLDQQPDLVIAFWDGRSTGTLHTIEEAEHRGIEVEIVSPDPVP